jgi:hypothetical protein
VHRTGDASHETCCVLVLARFAEKYAWLSQFATCLQVLFSGKVMARISLESRFNNLNINNRDQKSIYKTCT